MVAAARAIAWRHLYKWITVPANFLPTFLFPLVFFTGFAGALGKVGSVPGFDYDGNYTTWMFGFSLLQTCLFGGLATGFTIAGDFQSGFARRLMLATRDRRSILLGYLMSTCARASVMSLIVTIIAMVVGMRLAGNAMDWVVMYLLSLTLSVTGTLWSAGVMFRARDPQLGPAMQIPMFLAIFVTPAFVPLDLLHGWLRQAASVNPISYIMQTVRNLAVGHVDGVAVSLLAVLGMWVVLGIWALTGVRAAERSGG